MAKMYMRHPDNSEAEKASLTGTEGNDKLYGDTADNFLYGGGGDDFLYGSGGTDVLVGGLGHDTLKGGGSADIFRYSSVLEGGDIISDFRNDDSLDLTELFESNGLGDMSKETAIGQNYLTLTQSGEDLNVRFDADGRGGSASTLLARIEDTTVADLMLSGHLTV